MDYSGYASLIELLFSGGLVLGFAIWQLVSVRREIARDRAAAETAKNAADAGAEVPVASPKPESGPLAKPM